MLQDGSLYQVPRSVFLAFAGTSPDIWKNVTEQLLTREQALEEKVALLCLHDVEYRILHYLLSLGRVFGVNGATEYSIPLSQSELAHLIGATRETTSTTLNTLARRGIVKLGRRLLMVTSIETVRTALSDHHAPPRPISVSVAATQNL
jgi:CRP/FNR family transcriptional regulator